MEINGYNKNVFYTTDSSNNLSINYYIDTGYLSYDLINNNGNISSVYTVFLDSVAID